MVVSAVFTRGVRDFAMARGWVSPRIRTGMCIFGLCPGFAGVAIFLALWAVVLAVRWTPGHLGLSGTWWSHVALRILGPATIVFLLGLWDDIRHLSAYWKFAVQIVAAALLYVSGFGIFGVSSRSGGSALGWMVGLPLTLCGCYGSPTPST